MALPVPTKSLLDTRVLCLTTLQLKSVHFYATAHILHAILHCLLFVESIAFYSVLDYRNRLLREVV